MLYFEDYQVGDASKFGRYEVARDRVLAFAHEFDPQPAHLSDEGAAGTIFGELAASGWHTCAMFMAMNVERLQRDPERVGEGAIGLGIDNLRWLRPVYPGDVLRCEDKVVETSYVPKHPDKGLVSTKVRVINQQNVTVMSLVSRALFPRRGV